MTYKYTQIVMIFGGEDTLRSLQREILKMQNLLQKYKLMYKCSIKTLLI